MSAAKQAVFSSLSFSLALRFVYDIPCARSGSATAPVFQKRSKACNGVLREGRIVGAPEQVRKLAGNLELGIPCILGGVRTQKRVGLRKLAVAHPP